MVIGSRLPVQGDLIDGGQYIHYINCMVGNFVKTEIFVIFAIKHVCENSFPQKFLALKTPMI